MNMESRDNKKKKFGIGRFIKAFGYSFDGLKYAYKYEQSMAIHFFVAATVVIAGIVVGLSLIEWLFVLMLMGFVMATELVNTSLEAVVDLISPEFHPLAKIAKDTASAAVLVFSSVAFVAGLILFVPKFINLIF